MIPLTAKPDMIDLHADLITMYTMMVEAGRLADIRVAIKRQWNIPEIQALIADGIGYVTNLEAREIFGSERLVKAKFAVAEFYNTDWAFTFDGPKPDAVELFTSFMNAGESA